MQKLLKKIKDLWPKSVGAEPWQIRATRYCVENDTFTEQELLRYITTELNQNDAIATRFFQENIYNSSNSAHGRADVSGSWFAPTELVSIVMDYDELKEARKNARNAWFMSLFALLASGVAAIFQALDYFS